MVKTDDDSFLNIPWFENFLLELHEDNRVYMGEPLGHYRPNRDPASIWYVSYDEYSAEMEESPGPIFMAGAAYLLSSDLTRHITKQVEMGATLFPLEDVGTALLMQGLDVKPGTELDGKINVFGHGEKCSGANVVMHYVSRDMMGCLADSYIKEGKSPSTACAACLKSSVIQVKSYKGRYGRVKWGRAILGKSDRDMLDRNDSSKKSASVRGKGSHLQDDFAEALYNGLLVLSLGE